MKQTHTIFYKQWLDYFDCLTVNVVLPEIILGKFYISDNLHQTIFLDKNFMSYHADFSNKIGYTRDSSAATFKCLLFGFGISITRQWSY